MLPPPPPAGGRGIRVTSHHCHPDDHCHPGPGPVARGAAGANLATVQVGMLGSSAARIGPGHPSRQPSPWPGIAARQIIKLSGAAGLSPHLQCLTG